jgi:hypothetical protein
MSRNRVHIHRTAPFEDTPTFHELNPWEVERPFGAGQLHCRFSWHRSYEDAVLAAQFYVTGRQLAAVAS